MLPCLVGELGLTLVTYHGTFTVFVKSGLNPVPYAFAESAPVRFVDKRDLVTLEKWKTADGSLMFTWDGRE